MKLLVLFLFQSVCMTAAFAQNSPDVYDGSGDLYAGTWQGIITQETPETTRYFDMELTVTPTEVADSLYEISSHVMDGDYHAYMVGRGFRDSTGQLLIAETEIIRSDSIPGMEWCVKRLWVTPSTSADEIHLIGRWDGETSFGPCEAGDLDMVRQMIRP